MLAAIEATMERYPETELPPRREYDDAVDGGLVEEFDPYRGSAISSRASLTSSDPPPTGRSSSNRCGAGLGWFSRLLDGGNLTIRELHRAQSYFGGVNPEPIRPNIDEWLAEIPRWGADIGIAFDGDADRVGMATEEGVFVNQLQVYGLLYWYLLEVRGRIGPAVYTVTTTSMVRRPAEQYGTEAHETGVGFKYVGPRWRRPTPRSGRRVGGFGFGMHILERDGLAAGLFLLDLWLSRGSRASEVLAELRALAGPSYYNRIDVRFTREEYPAIKRDTLARLENEAPTSSMYARSCAAVHSTPVTASSSTATTSRGLIRFSGTEALLRIYAEAGSPEEVDRLLAEGRRTTAAAHV